MPGNRYAQSTAAATNHARHPVSAVRVAAAPRDPIARSPAAPTVPGAPAASATEGERE
ncbi:conserved hypothetical protein [Burkholderia pseudomallei Pakistan 9]|nr:conserved hypothetical protein [Burkholderia pseudomallei Pakistan 9]